MLKQFKTTYFMLLGLAICSFLGYWFCPFGFRFLFLVVSIIIAIYLFGIGIFLLFHKNY